MSHAREVETLTPLAEAITPIRPPIVGIAIGLVSCGSLRVHIGVVSNTMRPRVIRIESHATASLAVHGKKHTVIALRPSIIGLRYERHQLSIGRALKAEAAPLVRIRGCRTARNVDCRIDLLLGPQMGRLCSDVGPRQKPIRSNLFLQTEIPR